jgi:hypothetical protein
VSRSTNPPNRRHGSLPEIDIYLGKTNKAVEKLVERRQIPFRRASKRLIFDFYELDQWVASLPGTTLQEAMDRCTGAAEGSAPSWSSRAISISLG